MADRRLVRDLSATGQRTYSSGKIAAMVAEVANKISCPEVGPLGLGFIKGQFNKGYYRKIRKKVQGKTFGSHNMAVSYPNPPFKEVCYIETARNYIPINDTSFELSVIWLSDTESRIKELRFLDYVSLSFKTRLTSVTCFCGDVT